MIDKVKSELNKIFSRMALRAAVHSPDSAIILLIAARLMQSTDINYRI
jgi:hypothetical protein